MCGLTIPSWVYMSNFVRICRETAEELAAAVTSKRCFTVWLSPKRRADPPGCSRRAFQVKTALHSKKGYRNDSLGAAIWKTAPFCKKGSVFSLIIMPFFFSKKGWKRCPPIKSGTILCSAVFKKCALPADLGETKTLKLYLILKCLYLQNSCLPHVVLWAQVHCDNDL